MKPPNSDPDAEVVLAHLDWVRGLARSLVSDPNLADDAAQETWVAALRHPPSPERPPRTWLRRVVRNAVLQIRRREAVRRGLSRQAVRRTTQRSHTCRPIASCC